MTRIIYEDDGGFAVEIHDKESGMKMLCSVDMAIKLFEDAGRDFLKEFPFVVKL